MNVPNQVTLARILLSILLFVFLACGWYQTSFVLFLLTAGTDWLDGYWARKYGQITQLGRVLDPFADKFFNQRDHLSDMVCRIRRTGRRRRRRHQPGARPALRAVGPLPDQRRG